MIEMMIVKLQPHATLLMIRCNKWSTIFNL